MTFTQSLPAIHRTGWRCVLIAGRASAPTLIGVVEPRGRSADGRALPPVMLWIGMIIGSAVADMSPMTKALFATTLVRENHVRTFAVQPALSAGWEVFEHEDHRLTRRQHHSDWHRVEHSLARFAQAIEDLRQQGWREV